MKTDELLNNTDIVTFFITLEKNVQYMEYGTISGNVQLKDGKPVPSSLSLVMAKRRRYKVK